MKRVTITEREGNKILVFNLPEAKFELYINKGCKRKLENNQDLHGIVAHFTINGSKPFYYITSEPSLRTMKYSDITVPVCFVQEIQADCEKLGLDYDTIYNYLTTLLPVYALRILKCNGDAIYIALSEDMDSELSYSDYPKVG